MIVDARAFEQRRLDPFVTQLERGAHLAREGGIGARAGVEGGVTETRRLGAETDVGGGAERGEEGVRDVGRELAGGGGRGAGGGRI